VASIDQAVAAVTCRRMTVFHRGARWALWFLISVTTSAVIPPPATASTAVSGSAPKT